MTQVLISKQFPLEFAAGPLLMDNASAVERGRQGYLLAPGGQDYVGDNSYDSGGGAP